MKYLILLLFFLMPVITHAKEIFSLYPQFSEREFIHRSPTARYIDAYGWESIANDLKNHGVTMVHRNLFDRISHREEEGFIGYHGSTQDFRIFQDIIRLILENIVGLSVREDFHFFRIPGDPLFSYKNLNEWGALSYDPSHFLCMNYAIYGNHQSLGSSSYYYFTVNGSANQINYEQKIKALFDRLEIDKATIHKLFFLGQKYMGQEQGVIYQVFDMSHYDPRKSYYQLADEHCLSYGSNQIFSSVATGTLPTAFPNQIRMLLNNTSTLNPYSSLVIKRFDKLSIETTDVYMKELQLAVCSLGFSQEKAESYRDELLKLWENNAE
jgi:hypothetical protein